MAEPLTWAEDVRPEWIDYNVHLSEAYYVLVFGHASDAAMVALGMTPEYLTQTRTSLFTRALLGDRGHRQAAVGLARDVVR